MTPTLNLAHDPWIEATAPDGAPQLLSLRDALCAPEATAALGGQPPVAAAVTRLLLAVLRYALGHGEITPDRWDAWWDRGLPAEEISDYLDRHAARFDLHGDTPFMQDPALDLAESVGGGWKSPGELRADLSTGNNATVYTHCSDLGGWAPPAMTLPEAAQWLIATQAFIRPGIFPGITTPRVSARSGLLLGRLVLIPTGPTLRHTLLLSLPLGARSSADLPVWHRRDRPVIAAPVPGPVSYLTWQARHILLAPPDGDGLIRAVKVAAHRDYDTLVPRDQQAAYDPHLLFTASEKVPDGWVITAYDPARSLWRDAAMIAAYAGGSSVLDRARTARGVPVEIEAYGLAVQSTAKYVDWIRTSVPVPRDPDALAYARQCAELTERAADAVRRAALFYLINVGSLSPVAPVKAKASAAASAMRPFWDALDTPAAVLARNLDDAAGPEARAALAEGWAEHALAAAIGALKTLSAPQGPTQKSAAAHGGALRVLANNLTPPEGDTA